MQHEGSEGGKRETVSINRVCICPLELWLWQSNLSKIVCAIGVPAI